jgi:hypothetical protein
MAEQIDNPANISDDLLFHTLGRRDGIIDVFIMIRVHGIEAGLRMIGEQYQKIHGDNPHIADYLSKHPG